MKECKEEGCLHFKNCKIRDVPQHCSVHMDSPAGKKLKEENDEEELSKVEGSSSKGSEWGMGDKKG